MSPFIMQSFKKIVGADFEKIDKVDFRHIQTYIQTYGGYLIGPSPAGGPKIYTKQVMTIVDLRQPVTNYQWLFICSYLYL